jgi:hypothetical protein
MGGANAFVIQAVNEMAVRQHAIDEKRRVLRRARGLPSRTVAEVAAAIIASSVIALMVAAGGFADMPVVDEACSSVAPDVCMSPDALTICHESNGLQICIKEAT